MPTTNINKPIQVGAIFKAGVIAPKWFLWDGRKYIVKKINLAWQRAEGAALIHYFSVSDDCNSYEISFDPKGMTWRLNKADLA